MCGRYARYSNPDDYIRSLKKVLPNLDGESWPNIPSGYNISPGVPILTVGRSKPANPHKFALIQWGFLPSWAKDESRPNINARSETVATSGLFRNAFNKGRCLVPADNYYLWKESGGKKIPHVVGRADHAPFCFAAIYELCRLNGLVTCAILTTEANETIMPIHHRMPLILHPENYADWCDPEKPGADVSQLLRPFPGSLMQAFPIEKVLNSPPHALREQPGTEG